MRAPALSLLFALVLAVLCPRARAQWVEGYGAVSINHLSSVELLPYSSSQFSTYTPVGGTFGGTFNFVNFHVVNIGLDIRDTAAGGANIWLGGVQVKAKPPVLPIKPYFRLSVGQARLHVPQTASSSIPNPVAVDYYLYNAALGVDYRLTRFLDIRAIEIGDGRTLGGGSANPTSFLTINTGFVLHTFDRATIDDYFQWLREARFTNVRCVYAKSRFAVLAATRQPIALAIPHSQPLRPLCDYTRL